MATPDLPIPSDRFQAALDLFVNHLKQGKYKEADMPEWAIMAAALEWGFDLLTKDGKLHIMFDTDNSFDAALLAWCVEVRNRERRKREGSFPPIPNPEQN